MLDIHRGGLVLTLFVSNSWTPHWGENGYIRILRTADEGSRCGTC